jgi:hypothetical protein
MNAQELYETLGSLSDDERRQFAVWVGDCCPRHANVVRIYAQSQRVEINGD